jgi:phosphonate transport system permease protein
MADIGANASLENGEIEIPRQPFLRRARVWLIWAAVIAILAWSWGPAEMWRGNPFDWNFQNIQIFTRDFFNPSFRYWETYANDMIVTIQIAAWGTALAVLFGAPFAILCSSNICPVWIVQPTRRFMDILRAVPEIVFALIFVVAVALGPIAGVLAVAVHNIGIIAKLFSEAVEAIDPRPVEGIRATGASRLQEVIFGVIPQVLPLWSSFTLYRFETNVRSATILGVIGAGGIGQPLFETMRGFQYSEAATIVIIIVSAVIVIDVISAQLRKMLV